jgi:hypothetical protein
MHLGVDTKVCESSTHESWAGRLTHVNTIVILAPEFWQAPVVHDKSRAAPSRCLLDSKSGDETMGAHWRLGQKSRIVVSSNGGGAKQQNLRAPTL